MTRIGTDCFKKNERMIIWDTNCPNCYWDEESDLVASKSLNERLK